MAAGDRLSRRASGGGVARPIFGIGHSSRSLDDLLALLRGVGVDLLVDVRAFPRSRVNRQFDIDTLPAALEAAGIGYAHMRDLGGRRGRQPPGEPSPNGWWRNESFRNYADWALLPAFRAALADLVGRAADHTCAMMCAEIAWQRCHRQIIADWLLAAGLEVRHIVAPGRIEPARLTPGAEVRAGGTVIYPSSQPSLL